MINTNQNLLLIATVLALCVISFVHVFVFPLYGISPKHITKTFADIEQSLCMSNLKRKRTESGHCPRDGIVTVSQRGRLGNQMWEYASVWAVARHTGLEPYIPICLRQRLDQIFETLTIPTLSEIAHCPTTLDVFVDSVDSWNYTNQSILLARYVILPEIVLTWVQDIVQEFTFKKKLRIKSQQILREASRHYSTSPTFVGVHVRRSDYINYLKRKYKVSPAEPKYFFSAMEYFESKFRRVVFVIVTDDPQWCKKHLTKKRNTYIANKANVVSSPGQDLAILAACNHTIFDYGTFGLWGALLAGGETIVYNITLHSAVRVAELLPKWHIMM